MHLWTELDTAGFDEQYSAWVEMIDTMHDGANDRSNPNASFVPLGKPLAEATVALVSTAGVHLDSQTPFDVSTTAGDPSYRLIPDDIDMADLRFTHTHYDTGPANEDANVVFPLDRLHEFVEQGRIGTASPIHVGLMGFNPDPTEIADVTGPNVAEVLVGEGVDAVVLGPG